jgi:hypothetical protein
VASPDDADALALTFAQPIRPLKPETKKVIERPVTGPAWE